MRMKLEWTVGKCLAKERQGCYSDAKDLILDLTTLRKELESARSTMVRTQIAAALSDLEVQPIVPTSTQTGQAVSEDHARLKIPRPLLQQWQETLCYAA